MAEETLDVMDLDLNLDPVPEEESRVIRSESVNLDEIVGDPNFGRIRDAFRVQNRQRGRWRRVRFLHETPVVELDQLMANSGHGSTLQTGEGSVAAEERGNEASKTCENDKGFLEVGGLDKKGNDEKGCGNDESFFDCSICFELSREPVVTSCGHLFCWPCLFKWLNVHSDAKECPVCKGEVTEKNLIPIYGRGSILRKAEEDSSLKIPPRPDAQRIESWRQTIQRTMFSSSMEEMFRRLNGGNDSIRDLSAQYTTDHALQAAERTNSLLNSILEYRSFWRERFAVRTPAEMVDLIQEDANIETRQLLPSIFPGRFQSHRAPEGERSHVPYSFDSLITGRNQEQPPSVDDRDSFSSVAAAINLESQTVDTAVEINSRGYLPTISSRRRTNASRTSNVDSRDSRTPRRRRLN